MAHVFEVPNSSDLMTCSTCLFMFLPASSDKCSECSPVDMENYEEAPHISAQISALHAVCIGEISHRRDVEKERDELLEEIAKLKRNCDDREHT